MRITTVLALTAMLGIVAGGPAYSASEPIGPALTISGTVEPTTVNATRTVLFTWTVSNQTALTHEQAKLLSVLKVGWALASGSDSRCTADGAAPYVVGCDLGELAPDALTTVDIRATVPADAQPGDQEISASAFSEHTPADAGAPFATVTMTVDRAPCMCTKEYNPVVGVDGKTYANPCMAKCAGVQVDPKAPSGIAPAIPDPYDTSAPAIADNVSAIEPGKPVPVSSASYMPPKIKPGEGWFYQLTLSSRPIGVPMTVLPPTETTSDNPAPCVCSVASDDKAVVGTDGNTYPNACVAECAGVKAARKGAVG